MGSGLRAHGILNIEGNVGLPEFVYINFVPISSVPPVVFPFVNFIFSHDEFWVQGRGGPGSGLPPPPRPRRWPQRRLDRRLEEVAKAVGGGYCRLQMPLTPALGARETVAGHRLGALEGGAPPPPPLQCIPAPPPPLPWGWVLAGTPPPRFGAPSRRAPGRHLRRVPLHQALLGQMAAQPEHHAGHGRELVQRQTGQRRGDDLELVGAGDVGQEVVVERVGPLEDEQAAGGQLQDPLLVQHRAAGLVEQGDGDGLACGRWAEVCFGEGRGGCIRKRTKLWRLTAGEWR